MRFERQQSITLPPERATQRLRRTHRKGRAAGSRADRAGFHLTEKHLPTRTTNRGSVWRELTDQVGQSSLRTVNRHTGEKTSNFVDGRVHGVFTDSGIREAQPQGFFPFLRNRDRPSICIPSFGFLKNSRKTTVSYTHLRAHET